MNNVHENNKKIKINTVEYCKINYNKSLSELYSFYDEQRESIKNGDKYHLSGEFMQLGYALDFIDNVQKAFNITLDFDESIIPTFDQIINKIYELSVENNYSSETIISILKKATGFFSVVVWKNMGGGFISSSLGYGINVKGTNVFVYNRIGRRLKGDKSADLVSFYQEIKNL